MLPFQGKVALVTGAAGGIGSATVELLAQRGARVVLADMDFGRAQALARKLHEAGGEALAVACDIGEPAQVEALVRAAVAAFGRLDVVVNNAAALGPEMSPEFDRDVETTALEVWDKAYRVNVRGVVAVCRQALPHLVAQGGGAIVNVASNLALQGSAIQNAYSASKAAVIQITRCIAASHGRRGVRCNAVLPGLTLTPSVAAHMPEAHRNAVEAENLLPGLGLPDDIARTIAFLASDEARHITAQLVACDGGNSSHTPGMAILAEATRAPEARS